MIKKIVSICLGIFIIAIIGIFILSQTNNTTTQPADHSGTIGNSTSSQLNSISLDNAISQTPQNTSTEKTTMTNIYSANDVAKHSTRNDCWMIINDKVYDVSDYLNIHPGGVVAMLPYCGAEATRAFSTKNQGQTHSVEANNLLNGYYVGDLQK